MPGPGYRERDQDMLLWCLGQYRGRETKTSCPGGWANTEGERPRHVVVVPGPVQREGDQDKLSWCQDLDTGRETKTSTEGRVRIQRERGGGWGK